MLSHWYIQNIQVHTTRTQNHIVIKTECLLKMNALIRNPFGNEMPISNDDLQSPLQMFIWTGINLSIYPLFVNFPKLHSIQNINPHQNDLNHSTIRSMIENFF